MCPDCSFFGSSSRKNPNQNHVWRRKEQGQKGVAGPKGGNDTRKLGAPPVPRVYQEHDSGRRSGVQVPLLSRTLPKRGRIPEGEKKPRKTKRRTRKDKKNKKGQKRQGPPLEARHITPSSQDRDGGPAHHVISLLWCCSMVVKSSALKSNALMSSCLLAGSHIVVVTSFDSM